MTVCIAAACNFGPIGPPVIVAASDRMISIGSIEYEPAQTKVIELATSTVGLVAGKMELHAAVILKVMAGVREILAEMDEPKRITVEEIANLYAHEFANYRKTIAEREVLMPLGMNTDKFLRNQNVMAHYQVKEITDRLTSWYVDSVAIIAGLDHTGAYLYKVRDPGVAENFNVPYFACIGSGAEIADAQFMVSKFDKTWSFERALWLTFSAKVRAEVAGGVGEETDLMVIGPGSIAYVLPEHKEKMHEIFLRTRIKEEEIDKEAADELQMFLRSVNNANSGPSEDQTASDANASAIAIG